MTWGLVAMPGGLSVTCGFVLFPVALLTVVALVPWEGGRVGMGIQL